MRGNTGIIEHGHINLIAQIFVGVSDCAHHAVGCVIKNCTCGGGVRRGDGEQRLALAPGTCFFGGLYGLRLAQRTERHKEHEQDQKKDARPLNGFHMFVHGTESS